MCFVYYLFCSVAAYLVAEVECCGCCFNYRGCQYVVCLYSIGEERTVGFVAAFVGSGGYSFYDFFFGNFVAYIAYAFHSVGEVCNGRQRVDIFGVIFVFAVAFIVRQVDADALAGCVYVAVGVGDEYSV